MKEPRPFFINRPEWSGLMLGISQKDAEQRYDKYKQNLGFAQKYQTEYNELDIEFPGLRD